MFTSEYIHMRLFRYQPYSPQEGDAYIDNEGSLQIFLNGYWNSMNSTTQMMSHINPILWKLQEPVPTQRVYDKNTGRNLEDVLDGIIYLLAKAGALNNVEEFKTYLYERDKAKELMEKFRLEDEAEGTN